jgi:hypothetical protein
MAGVKGVLAGCKLDSFEMEGSHPGGKRVVVTQDQIDSGTVTHDFHLGRVRSERLLQILHVAQRRLVS